MKTPTERPELTFDGCGINGPDEYRTRIATFHDLNGAAPKYGPLFAASPVLLAALESLFEHCAFVHKHWGEGSNQREADAAIESARAAIAAAKG